MQNIDCLGAVTMVTTLNPSKGLGSNVIVRHFIVFLISLGHFTVFYHSKIDFYDEIKYRFVK